MTEAAPEATPAQEPTSEQPAGEPLDAQPDNTDWKAEARKWEQRAKENKQAAADLDKQRKAAMTDAERSVIEAEERGRTTATTEFGKELAQTRFDALAGRRNADFDTAKALEYVDLTKFLGEDGRPDERAITAAVERLVPAAQEGPPSFDGGTRTTPPAPQGMSTLIRKAAGRA